MEDAEGLSDARALHDAEGSLDARAIEDADGLSIPHALHDADGPSDERMMEDAEGLSDARALHDAEGSVDARAMEDAEGPSDPRALHNADGPSDARVMEDAEGPSDERVIQDHHEMVPADSELTVEVVDSNEQTGEEAEIAKLAKQSAYVDSLMNAKAPEEAAPWALSIHLEQRIQKLQDEKSKLNAQLEGLEVSSKKLEKRLSSI
jgi:hypothetical protein